MPPRDEPWIRPTLERVGILPVLMVALLLVFGLNSKHFLTANNISTILTQTVYLVIVALAQTLVLLTAGFDLSVGSSIAFISIVTSMVLLGSSGGPAARSLLAATAGVTVGTAIGAVNGLIVALFGVSPFIVTLAMLSVMSGVALIVSGGVPIFGLPAEFKALLFTAKVAGLPVPWLVTAAIIALAYVTLYWTRLGRYWYAIGGNSDAAHLSGVPVRFYLFLAYTIAGLLVGIAGVLLTARVGSGEPNLGATLPLESISAAVLGGVSIRGGEGTLMGAVLGSFFLVLLRNGMDLTGVSSYAQMVVTGCLLILAIIVDRYIHNR